MKNMTNFAYIITGSGKISAVVGNRPYTVSTDHPTYQKIKQAISKNDPDEFLRLVDIPLVISQATFNKIKIANNSVYYDGTELHGVIVDRILSMFNQGFDISSMVNFLNNLMENPSRRAVSELYSWMEHQDIPITTDGCWIGYKYLNKAKDEYAVHEPGEPKDKDILLDVYSGKIRQWVGKVVEVPRNTVDENWGTSCSDGLHVGSISYSFNGDTRVIVKVNPRDVVTVPQGETNKCRVCRYEIVGLFEKEFSAPVVGENGENISNQCQYCGKNNCNQLCYGDDIFPTINKASAYEILKREIIENKIIQLVQELSVIDAPVSYNSTFAELEFDELDAIELIIELEDYFDISIDDEACERLKSIKDVIDLVVNLKS